MLKKCKECGKEFIMYNTVQNKCPWCTVKSQYKKVPKLAKLPKKPTIRKIRNTDNAKLKQKAWRQFSIYIRLRDCLSTTRTLEKGICYTCGKEFDFKGLQAGHCISGRGNFILLDEECVKAQCTQCNIQRNGNYDVFIPKIIRENSLEWFEEKKRLSKLPVKKDWKMEFEKYKAKTEELICSKDTPF
jgi:DNA-directed RNA polymerase subunit RPC12/RpoP